MKCSKHPRYKGIKFPVVECEECLKLFSSTHVQTLVITLLDGRQLFFSGPAVLNPGLPNPKVANIKITEPRKLSNDCRFEVIGNLMEQQQYVQSQPS